MHSHTAHMCQKPRKATFQVIGNTGYLILGRETAQKIGYISSLILPHPNWHSSLGSMHTLQQSDKSTEAQGSRQAGALSKTSKGPAAWHCSAHKWEEAQSASYQGVHLRRIPQCVQWNRDTAGGRVQYNTKNGLHASLIPL